MNKTCAKCKQQKPIGEFNKSAGRKDGHDPYCRECCRAKYLALREKVLMQKKDYYLERQDALKAASRMRYKKALAEGKREVINAYNREYWRKNREYAKRRITINHKRDTALRKIDPRKRIEHVLRQRIIGAVRKGYKSASTAELIGCDTETLMRHLEAQFKDGMAWENYGFRGWHIDHIKPCSSFNLVDPAEQRACFHYTNLQPLWAEDNQRKYNKTK